ncbi:MAG TPA: hypothetical protein VKW06_10900 [Candidatus Angelobacter sp.]|nr:hypothetical protein [Candidatus Angelobacter sp.]
MKNNLKVVAVMLLFAAGLAATPNPFGGPGPVPPWPQVSADARAL